MSAEAMKSAWESSPFKGRPAFFLVHLAVADLANEPKNYEIWASHQYLVDRSGVSRKTVGRFFSEAQDLGLVELLEHHSRHGRPNRYRLIIDTSGVPPEDPPPSETHDTMSHPVGPADAPGGYPSPTGVGPHVSQTQENNSRGTQEEPNTPTPSKLDAPGEALIPTQEHHLGTASKGGGNEEIYKRVFDAWVAAVGRRPEATKLTPTRKKLIKARLDEGYNEATLVAAVQGLALSGWHMGNNEHDKPFNDLDNALGDGAKVERFEELRDTGGPMDVVDRTFAKMAAAMGVDDKNILDVDSWE